MVTDRRTDRQTEIFPKNTEVLNPRCSVTLRKTSFSYLVLRRRLAAASESARALGWCACVHTCALLKWPPLPVPYEQKNALALQRSNFRDNPIYFLTSVGSWVCEPVFDAIYDWRSEFSHNRQNDRQTNTTTTVTLAAHARRGLMTDRQTDRPTVTLAAHARRGLTRRHCTHTKRIAHAHW